MSTDAPRRGAPRLRPYFALCAALACVSMVVVLVPFVPVAVRNPALSVMVSTLAAVVGLALLQLGLLRFSAFGSPVDLFAGLAFGTLGGMNLVLDVLAPVVGVGVSVTERTDLFLFKRLVGAAIFLGGLLWAGRTVGARSRARWMLVSSGAIVGVVVLGLVGLTLHTHELPPIVGESAIGMLRSGEAVRDVLPDQSPMALAGSGAGAVLLLLAALGYLALARRMEDAHLGSLAIGLTLLFFSQVHTVLFPPVAVEYVSTADGFRLAAYVYLLFGLVRRLGREIAERASADERLRLSRDLHDGLAQQLGLLNLRLSRATSPGRAADIVARDLEACRRLVETALLEARQAITALRTGRVTWEEVRRALSALAEEFGENHGVEVRFAAGGAAPPVSAEVSAELLRMLHEALSNAVRHGAAGEVDVRLSANGALTLRVEDDGGSFDPAAAERSAGLGLRSMRERVAARGGEMLLDRGGRGGAVVTVSVPLDGMVR